jgi:uncharacterized LabA/DUF88 family protein
MTNAHSSNGTAIFVDGFYLLSQLRYREIDDDILERLRAFSEEQSSPIHRRIYISGQKSNDHRVNAVLDRLHNMGFDVIRLNERDLELTVLRDALDIYPSIRQFILVSGELRFVRIVRAGREMGKSTVVAGFSSTTPPSLTRFADRIVHLDAPPRAIQPVSRTARSAALPTSSYTEFKIFLSYSRSDQEAVLEVYHRLKADGFLPWIDRFDLLPGQDFELEIRKIMRQIHVVVVFSSSESVARRGYVNREIQFALDEASKQPEGAIFIIPARLEPCDLPMRLERWNAVDLFTEQGYTRLVLALRRRHDELFGSAP